MPKHVRPSGPIRSTVVGRRVLTGAAALGILGASSAPAVAFADEDPVAEVNAPEPETEQTASAVTDVTGQGVLDVDTTPTHDAGAARRLTGPVEAPKAAAPALGLLDGLDITLGDDDFLAAHSLPVLDEWPADCREGLDEDLDFRAAGRRLADLDLAGNAAADEVNDAIDARYASFLTFFRANLDLCDPAPARDHGEHGSWRPVSWAPCPEESDATSPETVATVLSSEDTTTSSIDDAPTETIQAAPTLSSSYPVGGVAAGDGSGTNPWAAGGAALALLTVSAATAYGRQRMSVGAPVRPGGPRR